MERGGGTKTIAVDVRIFAATHRDIEEMVRTGKFRSDLLFRLNVFPIVIPPLRRRREDVPALVHHFVAKKSKDLKIYPPPFVLPEQTERLKAHHWPGNVRELENLVERALINNRGKKKNQRLTFELFETPRTSEVPETVFGEARNLVSLDEAASQHIRRAVEVCNGRISGPLAWNKPQHPEKPNEEVGDSLQIEGRPFSPLYPPGELSRYLPRFAPPGLASAWEKS
ncbi:MAG: sigma 54-interacting transcriptional regulator [Syntrophobacteraceae bacterium]|nr:sigma 54-interacting transcriptional regulator [Syntrophobacteraceae bacterium]